MAENKLFPGMPTDIPISELFAMVEKQQKPQPAPKAEPEAKRAPTLDLNDPVQWEAEYDRLLALGRTPTEIEANLTKRKSLQIERAADDAADTLLAEQIENFTNISWSEVKGWADDPTTPPKARRAAIEKMTERTNNDRLSKAANIDENELRMMASRLIEHAAIDGERLTYNEAVARVRPQLEAKAEQRFAEEQAKGTIPYVPPPVFDNANDKLAYGFQQLAEQLAAEAPAEASDGQE